jgi:hypothetical protein
MSYYMFCLQKVMEAHCNYKRADSLRDHDFWAYVEAKWVDLANYYRSDERRFDHDSPRVPPLQGARWRCRSLNPLIPVTKDRFQNASRSSR